MCCNKLKKLFVHWRGRRSVVNRYVFNKWSYIGCPLIKLTQINQAPKNPYQYSSFYWIDFLTLNCFAYGDYILFWHLQHCSFISFSTLLKPPFTEYVICFWTNSSPPGNPGLWRKSFEHSSSSNSSNLESLLGMNIFIIYVL